MNKLQIIIDFLKIHVSLNSSDFKSLSIQNTFRLDWMQNVSNNVQNSNIFRKIAFSHYSLLKKAMRKSIKFPQLFRLNFVFCLVESPLRTFVRLKDNIVMFLSFFEKSWKLKTLTVLLSILPSVACRVEDLQYMTVMEIIITLQLIRQIM